MSLAKSLRVTPMAINDRRRRSEDAEVSAASIFATRDWLDPMRFANSTWEGDPCAPGSHIQAAPLSPMITPFSSYLNTNRQHTVDPWMPMRLYFV
jgi:hypothetical protein